MDETKDVLQRCVLNFLVGMLDGKEKKSILVLTKFLEKTNNTTVQQGILDALNILYPKGIQYEELCLIVTDRAKYMPLAIKNLKEMFPNLHYVTYICHAIHNLCDKIRKDNPLANKFIGLVKDILSKSPQRQQIFFEFINLNLPSTVILTRWGTWIDAVVFYAENFDKIRLFLNEIESKSQSVKQRNS